jgi:hypothetical protein
MEAEMKRVGCIVVALALSACGHDDAGFASAGQAVKWTPGKATGTENPSDTPSTSTAASTAPPGEPLTPGERLTHYIARRDERMCPSPACGGFWVRAVNSESTLCSDGTRAPECYVSDLDLAALKLEDETRQALLTRESVFRGSLRGESPAPGVPPRGGALVASEAWLSRAPSLPSTSSRGRYYRVQDNGIVCATEPCASLTEYLLDSAEEQPIHGLDLTYAPGTAKDKADAQAETRTPPGLLAIGANATTAGIGNGVTVLRATQYFFRVGFATPTTH